MRSSLSILVLVAIAAACSAGCGSGAPTPDPATTDFVQRACVSYATVRPLVARVVAIDARFIAGDKAGAASDAAALMADARKAQSPQGGGDPAVSAGANDFVINVKTEADAIVAHLQDYSNLPRDGVLGEERGIVGGAGLLDAYAAGSDGRPPLCPGMSIPSLYPLFSPGVTPPPGYQLLP